MKRRFAAACIAAPLALFLGGCAASPEQQREEVALAYARTVSDEQPDGVCDAYRGSALVDPDEWDGVAVDSVSAEPTNAGDYIVALRYTQGGEEKFARVWLAPDESGRGYCVRIAADGADDR